MQHLNEYREEKPHRLKLIVWQAVNLLVFPLLTVKGRRLLLRLFGAKIGDSLILQSKIVRGSARVQSFFPA